MLNSSETQKGFSKVSSREDGECVGCVVLRRIKYGVWGPWGPEAISPHQKRRKGTTESSAKPDCGQCPQLDAYDFDQRHSMCMLPQ